MVIRDYLYLFAGITLLALCLPVHLVLKAFRHMHEGRIPKRTVIWLCVVMSFLPILHLVGLAMFDPGLAVGCLVLAGGYWLAVVALVKPRESSRR